MQLDDKDLTRLNLRNQVIAERNPITEDKCMLTHWQCLKKVYFASICLC